MLYTLSFFPPLQNAVCFIILTYLVPVLFTFYIQCVLKFKKDNSGAKRLMSWQIQCRTTQLCGITVPASWCQGHKWASHSTPCVITMICVGLPSVQVLADSQYEDPCKLTNVKTTPHVTHCDRYYSCYNGQTLEFDCPNGLVYVGKGQKGPFDGVCDYDFNVDCTGREKRSKLRGGRWPGEGGRLNSVHGCYHSCSPRHSGKPVKYHHLL